jgi:hypothetical protein
MQDNDLKMSHDLRPFPIEAVRMGNQERGETLDSQGIVL